MKIKIVAIRRRSLFFLILTALCASFFITHFQMPFTLPLSSASAQISGNLSSNEHAAQSNLYRRDIATEQYLTAREQMRRMPRYSTAQNGFLAETAPGLIGQTAAWEELGPGNLGGRTRALVIHPTNPSLIYAASVGGGVWKSADGGNSWSPLTDLMPNLAVSSLTMDPKNPTVLYAGTGEAVYGRSDKRGSGIFKTMDGGANWTHLSATKTKDFYYVYDLVVSPLNGQRIYAATNNGVWRTLDGGDTWSRVLTDRNFEYACWDLVIRTDQQTDFLFAAYGNPGEVGIYRNTDAGNTGTWVKVYGEFGIGQTSLAIAPSNQSVVYALSVNKTAGTLLEGLYAIFRSNNGGEPGSWTAQVRGDTAQGINRYLLSDSYYAFAEACGRGANRTLDFELNRGWYSRAIAVDPTDPDRVWVGGVDLFRSDDGGANWGLASYWWTEKASPQYVHADQKLIVFHPQYNGTDNQTMFVTNDGGIYRTNNARAAVGTSQVATCDPKTIGVAWSSLNKGYNVTQFWHGQPAPDGSFYVGGTQGNGIVRGSNTDGINGWKEILAGGGGVGDGGYVAIDSLNPATFYATKTDARASVWKTTDAGRTFSQVINGAAESGSSPPYFARLAMDPSDPLRLWLTSYVTFRTADGASRWKSTSGPIRAPFTVVAPTDSNFVMSADHRTLYFTTSGLGEIPDWIQPNPRHNPVTNGADPIANAAFDPINKRIAYIVYNVPGGKHVWRTANAGMNWQAIDGTGTTALPDVPVNCIAVDPNNTARLYVGTDMGVFVSPDTGANWAVENTGFVGVPVESLSFVTNGGVTSLYAFTNGRGAWRVATGSAGCQQTLSSASTSVIASGGSGTINVIASAANCQWTAESNANWIAVNSGGGGTGSEAVRFTVAPNPEFKSRAGTITIAGRSFNILQAAMLDTTPPIIAISFPTANPFRTRSRTVSFHLTITDNIGVTAIGTNNDRFGGSEAPSSSIGSSINVGLYSGVNNITITARDAAGNTASVNRVVIFTPEYSISTFAGTGQQGFSGDGGQAPQAQLNTPFQLAFDRSGNLYVTEGGNYRIRRITPNGIISTVAGTGVPADAPNPDGEGGPATAARLQYLRGITIANNGDIYFLEGFTHLRRIAADTGLLTTIARVASVFHPALDVAIDSQGNFLITGGGENRIYKVTPNGQVSNFAGNGNFSGPLGDGGQATQATVADPAGILLDQSGNVLFSSSGRIRKVTPDGIISSIYGVVDPANPSEDGGSAATASLWAFDLVFDGAANLYFSGSNQVRKITSDGIVNTIAGNGSRFYGGDGGLATSATLSTAGIAVDNSGNVYIADSENHRIRKLTPLPASDSIAPTITTIFPTSGSTWTTLDGVLYLSGTAADNSLVAQVSWKNDRGGNGSASGTTDWSAQIRLQPGANNITVTAWDAAGNAGSKTLAVNYNAQTTFASVAGKPVVIPASSIAGPAISGGFSGDGGPATTATLDSPRAIVSDKAGNLYIADTANHRIRRITPDGQINTFAGNGAVGSSGDGGTATAASLNEPQGLAVDAAGNVYIADMLNHRIRKVTSAGIISTVAGTGIEGFNGDGGAAMAAQLSWPRGLAIDAANNLLIADSNNHRIRKISMNTGIISTVAGNGFGYGGDNGPAAQALFRFPHAVAVDSPGNLYIADSGNYLIRKVSATGVIRTVAGVGQAGYGGENFLATAARLGFVTGITVDSAGNLLFAESTTDRIRRITPNGILTTLAGIGFRKFDDFGSESGDALVAQLNNPTNVAVVQSGQPGKIYIADTGNHRVLTATVQRESFALTSVSAASYFGQFVARESIVAAFGGNLTPRTEIASTLPLPTELAGISVRVRDSSNIERLAPLFFVSPGQINFLIPPETASGLATIATINQNGELTGGGIVVIPTAPGLFTANSNGQGVPAATVLRIKADGSQSYEPVARFDASQQRFVPSPIDLGTESDQVFLILFGTGIRSRSSLTAVTAQISGVNTEVIYAGPQGDFVGLDQINLRLSRALAGRGETDVNVTTDSRAANIVQVNFK